MFRHGFQPAIGRLELHFAVFQRHGYLGGGGFGEFFAAFAIDDGVVDTQAAFDFHHRHFHADFLAEAGGFYIFQIELHNRPAKALPPHFVVIVADGGEKIAARHFQIFHIMAVPHDVHGVDIEKRHFHFGAVAAVDRFSHRVVLLSKNRKN